MLDRGLTALGLSLFPAQVDDRSITPSVVTCGIGANCWSKEFPLKEPTLCVMLASMRLLGTEDRSRSRTRGSRNAAKETVHIKVIQNGLKTKHQAKKLFKTGILPATSYVHAAMGMCPSSIQHKKGPWPQTHVVKGSRLRAPLHSYTSILERAETQLSRFPLDQLRTWLELQGEEMEHRLGKIDIARAWAAASTNMRKKSRWSMFGGPMTATMATLHDLSIIPASPWEWYPAENPDVDWTCTLVATPAFSSVKCNRDSPTGSGNRRLCTIMVSVRKTVWT